MNVTASKRTSAGVSGAKLDIGIYDQTFENCRYCIFGCGSDHTVFRGFIECGTHKVNRMKQLQQECEESWEKEAQVSGQSRRGDGSSSGESTPKPTKKLDWTVMINDKLVKSCRVMAVLSTESSMDVSLGMRSESPAQSDSGRRSPFSKRGQS